MYFEYIGSIFNSVIQIDKVLASGVQGNMLASRSKLRGSNPAEVDGFFQDVKILSTSPTGGTLGHGS